MPTKPNHWKQDFVEQEDGTLLCSKHALSVCIECPFDYSLLEEGPVEYAENVHSDDLTEGEYILCAGDLEKYLKALIAMKGRSSVRVSAGPVM